LNFLIKAIHASLVIGLTKAKRHYPKILPPNKFLLSSLSEKSPSSYVPLKIEVLMTQPGGYLFHIVYQRRMNMEKQMAFFQMEDNDESTIWPQLPEENRQKIENIFARILIKYLSSPSEEVKDHEK
jgi:hypothetical protein